jgi:hypothetical protein
MSVVSNQYEVKDGTTDPKTRDDGNEAKARDTGSDPMVGEKDTDPMMRDDGTDAWKRDGGQQTKSGSHTVPFDQQSKKSTRKNTQNVS